MKEQSIPSTTGEVTQTEGASKEKRFLLKKRLTDLDGLQESSPLVKQGITDGREPGEENGQG